MTATSAAPGSHAWIMAAADRIAAAGDSAPRLARDPVNQPMVNNWVEAMGDANPHYAATPAAAAGPHGGVVAPPAMVQVWTMGGLHPTRDPGDPLHSTMAVLDEAGFTSVVATDSEQSYLRYLRPGEHLSVTSRLESVVGPKATGLGTGYFVTTRSTWYVGPEPVASMLFRVLKFRPEPDRQPPAPVPETHDAGGPHVIRPLVNRDTAFFWEGTLKGELRVQSCGRCGELRHPPGPMCPSCGASDPDYVVARGTGSLHSYAVHRHPPVPGRELPIVIALVELDEGVRMVGELLDVDEDTVTIGMPVQAVMRRVDEDLALPAWRPVEAAVRGADGAPLVGARLAGWDLPVTPTLVVSTAIATRDFQDVHHDRDLAVERGSRDIFLNILTTTGLVQRYVTDQLGHDVLVREVAIRLGAPAYPGDTLSFTGRVAEELEAEGERRWRVEVRATDALGDHAKGTVTVAQARAERP